MNLGKIEVIWLIGKILYLLNNELSDMWKVLQNSLREYCKTVH